VKEPTKADLATAVAKLTEENAGLRDLLAAVSLAADTVPVARGAGYIDEWKRSTHVLSVIKHAAALSDWNGYLAWAAGEVRSLAAEPVGYEVHVKPEPVSDAEAAGILVASIITGTPLVVTGDEPEYPAVGSAIPPESNGGQSGYRVGECGHRVAGSEWQAGFRRCEHCGPDLGDDEREYCPECGADEDAGEEHADKCTIGDEAAASVSA
jgi:hypothetical protein